MHLTWIAVILGMVASASGQEIRHYLNEYKGLRTGKSSVADVKSTLGEPENIEKTKNGMNMCFAAVRVNFSGADRTRINTIMIHGDRQYRTKSEVFIGFKVSDLKAAIPKIFRMKDYYVDFDEGVAFETDGMEVREIVLAESLRVPLLVPWSAL